MLQNSDKDRLNLLVTVVLLQPPPNPTLNIICFLLQKLLFKNLWLLKPDLISTRIRGAWI